MTSILLRSNSHGWMAARLREYMDGFKIAAHHRRK
jgi:hypothetical protein